MNENGLKIGEPGFVRVHRHVRVYWCMYAGYNVCVRLFVCVCVDVFVLFGVKSYAH